MYEFGRKYVVVIPISHYRHIQISILSLRITTNLHDKRQQQTISIGFQLKANLSMNIKHSEIES